MVKVLSAKLDEGSTRKQSVGFDRQTNVNYEDGEGRGEKDGESRSKEEMADVAGEVEGWVVAKQGESDRMQKTRRRADVYNPRLRPRYANDKGKQTRRKAAVVSVEDCNVVGLGGGNVWRFGLGT